MKHTDFNSRLDDIKRQEIRELRQALEAHGGSYSWYNDVTGEWQENYPIIPINYDGLYPNPMDINIRSVSIDELGHLDFVGEEKEYCNLVDFNEHDIFTGHISHITSAIPETNFVTDVSEQQEYFPVAYVSRNDLEAMGFYVGDYVDDRVMNRIANKMSYYLCNGDFSIDIVDAAEYMHVPYKHDIWFDNLSFIDLEKISGLKQSNFSSEDGYQAFVDAATDWWKKLSKSERKNIYEDNN